LDDDYYESHPMENRMHRTPSPGHPLQHGYHLEDNPYGHSPLDIPPQGPGRFSPGDSLQMQTPQSVDNLGGYSVNPEAHHDAYFNQPYEPNHGAQQQGFDHATPFYDDDNRPMLTHNDSQVGQSDPYHDNQKPKTNGGGIKRWKTVKQVLLYRGNLVLDCPIPPKLLNQLPHGERDEFTHMRYTAATCDPSSDVRE
jgi:chitin synthase